MRRPADQAKLLFLYLLRSSSAAFASEPSIASASSSSAVATSTFTNSIPPAGAGGTTGASAVVATNAAHLDGHITLRVARRADVPHIQRCNLASLPENYNSNFYVNHMRRWPELALVVEHVPASRVADEDGDGGGPDRDRRRSFLSPFRHIGDAAPDDGTAGECHIVGYVLGKVDFSPAAEEPPPPSSLWHGDGSHHVEERVGGLLGHVTSLAVLRGYRRRGLAAHLMDQLHYNMRESYRADAVGLHVRVSNEAARRLYCDDMGYEVSDVIRGYYQDGEDAYLMRKDLARAGGGAGIGSFQGGTSDIDEEKRRSFRFGFGLGGTKISTNNFSGLAGSNGPHDESHPMRLPRSIVDLSVNGSEGEGTVKGEYAMNGFVSERDNDTASVASTATTLSNTDSVSEGELVAASSAYVSH